MKFITLILSLLVMALTLVPCSDTPCDTEKTHTHEQHDDQCTPFCTCVCCGAQTQVPQYPFTYSHSPIITYISLSLPQYNSTYTPGFHHSIWQPPKI